MPCYPPSALRRLATSRLQGATINSVVDHSSQEYQLLFLHQAPSSCSHRHPSLVPPPVAAAREPLFGSKAEDSSDKEAEPPTWCQGTPPLPAYSTASDTL
eukprot:14191085-Ditylum_brightwellii.AAC.1